MRDLADATWLPLNIWLYAKELIVNSGTGNGVSVLDLVIAFEEVSGQTIHYQIVDSQSGHVAKSFTNANCASELMS